MVAKNSRPVSTVCCLTFLKPTIYQRHQHKTVQCQPVKLVSLLCCNFSNLFGTPPGHSPSLSVGVGHSSRFRLGVTDISVLPPRFALGHGFRFVGISPVTSNPHFQPQFYDGQFFNLGKFSQRKPIFGHTLKCIFKHLVLGDGVLTNLSKYALTHP